MRVGPSLESQPRVRKASRRHPVEQGTSAAPRAGVLRLFSSSLRPSLQPQSGYKKSVYTRSRLHQRALFLSLQLIFRCFQSPKSTSKTRKSVVFLYFLGSLRHVVLLACGGLRCSPLDYGRIGLIQDGEKGYTKINTAYAVKQWSGLNLGLKLHCSPRVNRPFYQLSCSSDTASAPTTRIIIHDGSGEPFY